MPKTHQKQVREERRLIDHLRDVRTIEDAAVPNMFLLPGGKPIEKVSNLSRFLAKKLDTNVPSATSVRKMGTTAVARVCTRRRKGVLKVLGKESKTDIDMLWAVVWLGRYSN
jgi:hypothetical protein